MMGRVRRAGGWSCLHRGNSASLDVRRNTLQWGCSGCPTFPGHTVYRGRGGCMGFWVGGGTGRGGCGPEEQDEKSQDELKYVVNIKKCGKKRTKNL